MGHSPLSLADAERPAAAEADAAGIAAGLSSLIENGAGELVEAAVRRVLERGHRVNGDPGSTEVLNQTLCQVDPRRRVLSSDASSFNPAVAVARLVWHLGGNSDLGAIDFYEPRARLFSDDAKVLPGSNTGARIFGARDGIDQVEGLISRLAEDPASRRGTAVVWRPLDAIRTSRDIPCTLAIASHLREGQLITTVVMRSNNALRLLPYNLFEFTMLAELIAVELGANLGPYWHSVLSLHVFDADTSGANALLDAGKASGEPLPPMSPHPLQEASRLVEHERKLRAAFLSKTYDDLPSLVAQAETELHPYWFGLYAVLTLFAWKRAQQSKPGLDLERLQQAVPAALRG